MDKEAFNGELQTKKLKLIYKINLPENIKEIIAKKNMEIIEKIELDEAENRLLQCQLELQDRSFKIGEFDPDSN